MIVSPRIVVVVVLVLVLDIDFVSWERARPRNDLFASSGTLHLNRISNVPGPDCAVTVGGRQVRDVMFWFPPLDDAAVSVSFVTYAGQLYMTVAADRAVLPNPDFVTTAFVAEVTLSEFTTHFLRPTVYRSVWSVITADNWRYVALVVVLWRPALSAFWSVSVTALR